MLQGSGYRGGVFRLQGPLWGRSDSLRVQGFGLGFRV